MIQYIYTQRKNSTVERAHLIESTSNSTVETLCGLSYQRQPDFMNECASDDLPHLVCRNCKRIHRSRNTDSEQNNE